jgi:DNA-directed RNA polymerase II subunit RPB1
MYHVGMASIILKMLRCVCVFCSNLLVELSEEDPRLTSLEARDRLLFVSNLCKSRRPCRACGGPQPKFVFTRATASISLDTSNMKFESEEEKTFVNKPFTPARARAILADIPDSVVRILGSNPLYARPEWMVLTVLQVPPPISRPCITASDGSRTKGQDDVTVKLMEIFKANKVLDSACREAGVASGFMPPSGSEEWREGESWDLEAGAVGSGGEEGGAVADKLTVVYTAMDVMQQHLIQYFHHGSAGMEARGGGGRSHSRALRLIPARWRGKKGRFRGNLAGKRVNYSSRTVASPAPDYDVDEVGVPAMVAHHLTFPERVTPFNMDMLTEAVCRGPGVAGGATSVIVPGSDPIDLSLCNVRDSLVLEVGWIVERHLLDGDWVLLNRQPSLHRMSIMAHRIRIIADRTFRLPVCDTTPYNADFDGDELNIHVLQTHDARAEAEGLMSVSTQMINPENNKPIVALVQDSLVAAYLMTRRSGFLERHQAMQLLMNLRYLPRGPTTLPPPAILKPRPLWTGKQMFSLLFPPTLVFDMVVRNGLGVGPSDPLERCVKVRHGELLCGSLCKKTLGTSAGGLVHVMIRDWGFRRAGNFVSDAQRILQAFMMIRGFSVGVGDCVMSEAAHDRVTRLLDRTFKHTDRVRSDAAAAPAQMVDACVTKILGSMLTRGGAEVMKDPGIEENNISVMIECGAKGSAINIAQILSCVGQQSVEGGRIRMGVGNRTLPCYRRGDDSAGARGFVCNSYGTGLTAQEYFFHAMGGREGLVDTAVKTAATGYIQRRLSKAQEGLQVRYDSTVRNSNNDVIQFYYGGDSYYPTKLERSALRTFKMDNAELRAEVVGVRVEWEAAVGAEAAELWMAAAEAQFQTFREERDSVRAIQLQLEVAPDGRLVMPVAPARVLKRAAAKFGRRATLPPPAHPDAVASRVQALLSRVQASRRPYATHLTRIYIRTYLSLRNIMVVHCLSTEALDWVVETIWFHFNDALAEPGEMVGTVGASSIGAPCTQMTLNTFHTVPSHVASTFSRCV